jgi:acetyltransferase
VIDPPDRTALPPNYPADLQRVWRAADGTVVTLRPLRPDDVDRELAFIAGLSEQTLHLRLQHAARGVNRAEVERLLQLDYQDQLAIGAFVTAPGGEQLMGVSRYARLADGESAECAVVVADDWHGRGIGTELMRSLWTAAWARGIRWLVGTTMAGNDRLGNWARRFGFEVRTEPNSGGLLKVTLDLCSLPS